MLKELQYKAKVLTFTQLTDEVEVNINLLSITLAFMRFGAFVDYYSFDEGVYNLLIEFRYIRKVLLNEDFYLQLNSSALFF